LADIQRKIALSKHLQLTFPGETLVLVRHRPTLLGGAFAACGSPYSSMLRLLGQFFVESRPKLNVLRLLIQVARVVTAIVNNHDAEQIQSVVPSLHGKDWRAKALRLVRQAAPVVWPRLARILWRAPTAWH
jgi:hypothetical protein